MSKSGKAVPTTVEELMAAGAYSAAERRLLDDLAKAERADDRVLIAQCHANLGRVAEALGRAGDAIRYWAQALTFLDELGLSQRAEGLRLRHLIRRWHEIPRVWISYTHSDKENVAPVVDCLRAAGIEVMWDEEFVPGHMIVRQVRTAISHCAKYVVMWSRNAQNRPWINHELEILKEQRRSDIEWQAFDNVVIFYCLDETPLPDESTDDVQIFQPRHGFENAVGLLIRSIKTSEISM